MSKKKKALLIISGILALTVGITVISVLAVHDLDLFELDENAINDGTVLGDDWDQVEAGTSGGIATIFVADGDDFSGGVTVPPGLPSDDTTYFKTGGSKDVNDIDEWRHQTGDVAPDKDEILNAYASAYVDGGSGDLIIYFGLDRFANNGDSQVGFWFFQSTHSLNSDGTFSGIHDIGDILVLSHFTKGGTVDTIEVYEWVGPPDADNLELVTTGAECASSPPNDEVCATVNDNTEFAPWPYVSKFPEKGDSENDFAPGTFYEGGVNVTALDLDIGCGGSFLAETRSSQSLDAQLKDFALGSFALCSIGVTKDGPDLSKVGDGADYTITNENTGAITLYKDSIIDSVFGDITDGSGLAPNVSNYVSDCGDSLTPAGTCTITLTYEVQPGDPDPLENTVTATYNNEADFSGSAVDDEDDHSVNLFQPAVTVDKTGDVLSKVTDPVTYNYLITNTSSTDSPDLILDSVTDSGDNNDGAGLGDLTATAIANECSPLAPGDSCSFSLEYIVLVGDDDPLNNTVVVHYHPEGFPNDISDSDDHEVDLFQPSIEVTKTGDALSKVGDDVIYSVLIENTSSSGSPALWFDLINDSLQGDLTNADNYDSSTCEPSLDAGASCQIDYTYTVQSGDPDPLVNTVTVESHPFSFPNDIDDSDEWSVNLFQPSISVTKTGDDLSKVGDSVSYSVTINNTSSPDSPALVFDLINDSLKGDLANAANYNSSTCGASLAAQTSCLILYTYTVQAGAPDPLLNTVTVESHPDGFTNDIDGSDGHSVNLFQPSISVTKTGDDLSKVGDDVSYSVTIENTSSGDSPALVFDLISDSLKGDLTNAANYDSSTCGASLAAQTSCTIQYVYTVQGGAPDPLLNTVTVESHPDGFTNDIDGSDGHTVNLFQPSISVTKTGDELSKLGDDLSYSVTIENTSSADSPALVFDVINDTLKGDLTNAANYDSSTCGASLAAQTSCLIQYTYTVQAGDPDPLLNTVTVESHPDGFTNDIDGSDGHSVNLFQPDYTLVCSTPSEFYTVGDVIPFTFVFTDTGSSDSPPFVYDSHNFTVGGVGQSITLPGSWDGTAAAAYNHTVVSSDPSPLVASLTTVYGFDNFPNLLERSDSCSVVVKYGCMLSPGFWGGGEGRQKWDQALDPIAIAAGFTTETPFPWVDTNEFPGGLNYLEVLGLPTHGDVTIQLSFKYIAARLNVALAGELSLPVPGGLVSLLDDIDSYFATNAVGSKPNGAAKEEGKAILNDLNNIFSDTGEEYCPNTGTIPEYNP